MTTPLAPTEATGDASESDIEILFTGTVPGPNGTSGFSLLVQLKEPDPADPDEAYQLTAPRAFATPAFAEAMALKAIAYHRRTGRFPDLGSEAFYTTAEPPDTLETQPIGTEPSS